MFHVVVFLGSDTGSRRICFILFYIIIVFLTKKLIMFTALSFENRHELAELAHVML